MRTQDRTKGPLTCINTPWHVQRCPKCEKSYSFLALGHDLHRDNVVCPPCENVDLDKESVLSDLD